MRAFPGGDILWPSTSSYSLLLCSSVATGGSMGGGTCPQPQSAGVMGIAEIQGEKIGGGVPDHLGQTNYAEIYILVTKTAFRN